MPKNPAEKPSEKGIESTVGSIVAATAQNVEVSGGVEKPSPAQESLSADDSWKSEPLANFEQDGKGNVVFRDGKPVRRGGRPRKLKPGEPLAGGGVAGDDVASPEPVSVVRLGEDSPDAAPEDAEKPGVELGEDAGAVVMDTVFGLTEAAAGPKGKPTTSERQAMKSAASQLMGGLRLAPWAVLTFVGLVYLLRVYGSVKLERRKEEATKVGEGNQHRDSRPDPIRKDVAGQSFSQLYPV